MKLRLLLHILLIAYSRGVRRLDSLSKSPILIIQGGQRSELDNDYDEPFIPPNEDEDASPSSANIQFMITNRMRYILENDLGYLPEEVDEMEPQIVSSLSFL